MPWGRPSAGVPPPPPALGSKTVRAALNAHKAHPWQSSAQERAVWYSDTGQPKCCDRPAISLPVASKDLETVFGAVRHVLSCVEACSKPAYQGSLWHWRTEMQRPETVRALHMFAVLHECVRVLQDSAHHSGIVEMAKAMLLIDFGKKAARHEQEQRRKVKRPKPLSAFVRLCATQIPSNFSWQAGSRETARPSWGGAGQNATITALATFLLNWMAAAAAGHTRSEPHVYGNVLSLLVEIWDVADKPGLMSRFDDGLELLFAMDALLAVWYERAEVPLLEEALLERMFALGVVGMLLRRVVAMHPSITKNAIYSKLRAKHSVLEKLVLQKLKETPSRKHVARVTRPISVPRASEADKGPDSDRSGGRHVALPHIEQGTAGSTQGARTGVAAGRRTQAALALLPRAAGSLSPRPSSTSPAKALLADTGSLWPQQESFILRQQLMDSGAESKDKEQLCWQLLDEGSGAGREPLETQSSEPLLSARGTTGELQGPQSQAGCRSTGARMASDSFAGEPHRLGHESSQHVPHSRGASRMSGTNLLLQGLYSVRGASRQRYLQVSRSQPELGGAVNGHWSHGVSRPNSSLAEGDAPSGGGRSDRPVDRRASGVRVEAGRLPNISSTYGASLQMPMEAPAAAELPGEQRAPPGDGQQARTYIPTKHLRSYAYRTKSARRNGPPSQGVSALPAPAPQRHGGRRRGREEDWDLDMLGGWEADEGWEDSLPLPTEGSLRLSCS